MIFLQLFLAFLKIGIFTFGGGYAMVALIQDEVVLRHAWLSPQEYTDLLAISQMTPGPIGINTATYAGFVAVQNAGYSTSLAILGSLLASFAVVLLPASLMLLTARLLLRHNDNPLVATILRVMRLAIVGLIASAALLMLTPDNFGTPSFSNPQFLFSSGIFLLVFLLMLLRPRFHRRWLSFLAQPIPLLFLAGALGVAFSLFLLTFAPNHKLFS